MFARQFIHLVVLAVIPLLRASAHDFYVYSSQLAPEQVIPGVTEPLPGAAAELDLRFDGDTHNGGPHAFYSVRVSGLDLDGQQTTSVEDDVLAIRFRIAAAGEIGPHALNVFAASGSVWRQDDAELFLNPSEGLVEGVWNLQDQSFTGVDGTRLDTDSVGVLDAARPLIEGNLYLEILTARNPDGLLRGQVLGVESSKTIRYFNSGELQLTLFSASPRVIEIYRTTDWLTWQHFTNRTAAVEVLRMIDPGGTETSAAFYSISESSVLFPTITSEPEDVVAASGGTAQFSVAVDGSPPFVSQWFHNSQPIQNATELLLPLSDINFSAAGSYHVVVSNLVGSVTSQTANLTVQP